MPDPVCSSSAPVWRTLPNRTDQDRRNRDFNYGMIVIVDALSVGSVLHYRISYVRLHNVSRSRKNAFPFSPHRFNLPGNEQEPESNSQERRTPIAAQQQQQVGESNGHRP